LYCASITGFTGSHGLVCQQLKLPAHQKQVPLR